MAAGNSRLTSNLHFVRFFTHRPCQKPSCQAICTIFRTTLAPSAFTKHFLYDFSYISRAQRPHATQLVRFFVHLLSAQASSRRTFPSAAPNASKTHTLHLPPPALHKLFNRRPPQPKHPSYLAQPAILSQQQSHQLTSTTQSPTCRATFHGPRIALRSTVPLSLVINKFPIAAPSLITIDQAPCLATSSRSLQ